VELLREVVVAFLRQGLPVGGAVYGVHRGLRKGGWKQVLLWGGGGWLAGWLAGRLVLGIGERMAFTMIPPKPHVPGLQPGAPAMPAAQPEEPVGPVAPSMEQMGYTAQARPPQVPPQPSTRTQKGGGEGVSFGSMPDQTGKENAARVVGTLFRDAYGGSMGI
jgi:hypothetical protein